MYQVGTSGYSYDYWGSSKKYPGLIYNFYPEELKSTEFLKYYSIHFRSVEINCTAYRILKPEVCEKWVSQTPEDFTFTLKAPRYITHGKKLSDFKEWLEESQFQRCIDIFNEHNKFGCVLFQFDNKFTPTSKNIEKINNVSKILSQCGKIQCAFEFRNSEWYDSVDQTLDRIFLNQAMTICEMHFGGREWFFNEGFSQHQNISLLPCMLSKRNFRYVRLHGPDKFCHGSYGYRYLIL